jgi:hypothetical protein
MNSVIPSIIPKMITANQIGIGRRDEKRACFASKVFLSSGFLRHLQHWMRQFGCALAFDRA